MQGDFDFDAYLHRTVKALTTYCTAVVGSADAEDAAQEAYIRLYANLYRIPDERAATAFLYRTAYRLSIDMLRSRKRFREIEVPAPHRMQRALLKLKPLDRSVIYLRVVEEYGYNEIAARFGKNEAWARKRYSIARKRLETVYTAQC